MSEQFVTSIQEWQRLPDLDVPALATASEVGAVFTVHKVGFLLVTLADCQNAAMPVFEISRGRCALPTITVDHEGQSTLHRLPPSLSGWAFSEVALARLGIRKYPSRVEFGCVDNRAYAEIR